MYIFDLDGTLTDSNGLWGDVDNAFLSRRGLTATEEYTETVGKAIFPTAAQFTKEYYGLDDDPQAIMDEWEELARYQYTHVVPLKAGAKELLDKCKADGIPLTLFTASRAPLCMAALRRFGMEDYFDHVVFAEEIGLEKHDPRCFTRLCEIIGADPADCTLFDDSPSNCATARAAGMNVVGVYDFFYGHRWEEMQAVCTRCVRSLEELL